MLSKDLLAFLSHYPVKRYAKGELILVEGEVPSCAFMVKKGIVKGYGITSEGIEKPIAFDTAGEVLPIGWIFGQLRWSPYYYDAYRECELYCVPRDEYLAFLKERPDELLNAHQGLVGRYLYFQMRVSALEQSKAVDKVVHTLHFLSLRFGKDVGPHQVRITLPLSQQEFANIIGLTRETTSIELNKLIKRGIIKQDGQKHYLVFTDRLNEALDTEYGQGLVR